MLRRAKRGGCVQHDGRGLQRQRRNQSVVVAHSAMAAARWEQCGGCGGFTGTVRKWANASAFERHRLANYASLSLVEDGGTTALMASSLSPMATSTAVADAPPLRTTMPMATPTTLFVKLNLIYYYYLFIYHYVDQK